MSPMDGLELTRKVRSATGVSNPFVPIVMTTANSEERHVIQARNAGVTEFLVKPLTVRSVYSRLCAIIERPRVFVNGGGYLGPDRRRRNDPSYSGAMRREADKVAAAREAAAEKAARAKAEKEAKAEAPVDPSAMSQEELADKLRDKD